MFVACVPLHMTVPRAGAGPNADVPPGRRRATAANVVCCGDAREALSLRGQQAVQGELHHGEEIVRGKEGDAGCRPCPARPSRRRRLHPAAKGRPRREPLKMAGRPETTEASQPSRKKKPTRRRASPSATTTAPGAATSRPLIPSRRPSPRPEQLPLSDPNWTWKGSKPSASTSSPAFRPRRKPGRTTTSESRET